MAKLTTDATLKIFIAKSFEKDGETVEYNTAYFLTEDGEGNADVITCNTKKDLASFVDEQGSLTVETRPDGKLALVSFRVSGHGS